MLAKMEPVAKPLTTCWAKSCTAHPFCALATQRLGPRPWIATALHRSRPDRGARPRGSVRSGPAGQAGVDGSAALREAGVLREREADRLSRTQGGDGDLRG